MLFTTSRKPSKNTRIFTRRISNLIPSSIYIVRGKKSTDNLLETARANGFSKICVITDKQGNPHKMRFIEITKINWDWAEELVIKGTNVSKEKITTDSIKTSKKLEKLFNIKSDEDSIFSIEQIKNEIMFKKGKKILIKIKLEETKS